MTRARGRPRRRTPTHPNGARRRCCGASDRGPGRGLLRCGSRHVGPPRRSFGTLNLLVNATVRIAGASDWNVWALVGSLGRALAAIMSDADVTLIVVAMHGVAFAALIALQRLLGTGYGVIQMKTTTLLLGARCSR